MSKLTIIRGLPGSGKSALAHEIAKSTGAIIIEPDMFCTHNGEYTYSARDYDRARRLAMSIVRQVSRLGADIIYADVLPRYQDVNQIIGQLTSNGYVVEVHSRQLRKENSINRNRHHVDPHDIEEMANT